MGTESRDGDFVCGVSLSKTPNLKDHHVLVSEVSFPVPSYQSLLPSLQKARYEGESMLSPERSLAKQRPHPEEVGTEESAAGPSVS